MHTETEPIATPEPTRFQCRHIKTDGLRCRSACLRHEQFCYFHHTTRVPIRTLRERKATLSKHEAFDLNLIEDRPSIQLAIAHILQRIASNELDPRRAGLLLYGLQIASVNLPPIDRKAPAKPEEPVEDTVEDPTHGTIAAIGQVSQTKGGDEPLRHPHGAVGERPPLPPRTRTTNPTTPPPARRTGPPSWPHSLRCPPQPQRRRQKLITAKLRTSPSVKQNAYPAATVDPSKDRWVRTFTPPTQLPMESGLVSILKECRNFDSCQRATGTDNVCRSILAAPSS